MVCALPVCKHIHLFTGAWPMSHIWTRVTHYRQLYTMRKRQDGKLVTLNHRRFNRYKEACIIVPGC